jgi:hypothetical protein
MVLITHAPRQNVMKGEPKCDRYLCLVYDPKRLTACLFGSIQHASTHPKASVPPFRDEAGGHIAWNASADSGFADFEVVDFETNMDLPTAESSKANDLTRPESPADSLSATIGRETIPVATSPNPNHFTVLESSGDIYAGKDTHQADKASMGSRSTGPYTRKRRMSNRRMGKPKMSPKGLADRRWSVLEDRLKARELRNALRYQRSKATDADIAFMDALRVFAAENPSLQSTKIFKLYEECQKARDVYQPFEDNYNTAENLLDQRDFELGEIEKEFYQTEASHAYVLRDEDEAFDQLNDPEDSLGSSDSPPDFSHYPPVLLEYYSRLGDRTLIRERISDLRTQRAILVDAQRLRQPFGISLDEESGQFLADFDKAHGQIQAQLTDVEADISRLRISCEQEGFLDREGTIRFREDEEGGELLELDTPGIGRDRLLFREGVERPAFSDISGDSTDTRITKARFIDRWLLYGLRESGLEIMRLKSLLDPRALNVPDEQLNELVLEWWPKDSATVVFLSHTTKPTGHSLTILHGNEEETRRAASLGQPGRLLSREATFSLASF